MVFMTRAVAVQRQKEEPNETLEKLKSYGLYIIRIKQTPNSFKMRKTKAKIMKWKYEHVVVCPVPVDEAHNSDVLTAAALFTVTPTQINLLKGNSGICPPECYSDIFVLYRSQ